MSSRERARVTAFLRGSHGGRRASDGKGGDIMLVDRNHTDFGRIRAGRPMVVLRLPHSSVEVERQASEDLALWLADNATDYGGHDGKVGRRPIYR